MLKTVMRAVWVVMACAIIAGDANAGAPAKKPKTHTSAGVAFFAGDLSFVVVGDRLQLTASGVGQSSPWGGVVAQATWSPTIDDALALLAGQIDELTINTGTFS